MKTTIIAVLIAFALAANAYAYPIKAVCANSTIAPHGVWDCR
jgi:hypothetical protein